MIPKHMIVDNECPFVKLGFRLVDE